MNRLERFSLFLVAAGIAVVWLMPDLLSATSLPEWVGSRFYLYISAPAAFFGCYCFHRYGGFARSLPVLLCAFLMCAGILWTDATEQGRGMLLAAGFLLTLPVSALIRKHNYLPQFLGVFAVVTAIGMLYGLTQPAGPGRWGTIVDSTGTQITNANVVGTQAAAGIVAALIGFPRRKWSRVVFVAALVVLSLACFLTQTRTGLLALTGAGGVIVFMRLRRRPALLATAACAAFVLFVCLFTADFAISNGAVYRGVVNRLVWDEEDNLGSLGDRTKIWQFAARDFLDANHWLTGVGTGGVDKELGKFYEFSGRLPGRDRLWRLYPHNSLVQNGLAFGLGGLALTLLVALRIARNAYLLDSLSCGWQRCAFVMFLGLVGTGLVVQREVYWIALGSALWAMVSTAKAPQPARMARSLARPRAGVPAGAALPAWRRVRVETVRP